jgi:hypothetical protein
LYIWSININKMEKGISTQDVWVVTYNGMYNLSKIYLDKNEAEEEARENNESYYKICNKKENKYVVKSLADAIDMINESGYERGEEAGYERGEEAGYERGEADYKGW